MSPLLATRDRDESWHVVSSRAMERANIAIQKRIPQGRRIIEEAGGVAAYDQKARERLKLFSPTIEVKRNDAIVFEGD